VCDAPPAGTKIEGATGPGDSGGPSYVEIAGKTYLAGVGSFSTGEGADVGKYGVINASCRISTHVAWINRTIAADPPATVQWSPLVQSSKAWPKSAAGQWVKSYFDLYNKEDFKRLAVFIDSHRAVPGKTSVEQIAETYRSLFETYGAYDLYGYRTAGPYRMAALVYSAKAKQWRSLDLELNPAAPHRTKDFYSADEDPPKGAALR